MNTISIINNSESLSCYLVFFLNIIFNEVE